MTTKVDTSLISEARNKEKIQQILGYLVTKKTLENEKQGGSYDPKVVKELTDMGFSTE